MYKVMLVDDEYMILEGLKQILPWQELGFEIVKTARNAKEALAFLEEQAIDLLITDINMPEISGIQLIETAQNEGQHFFSLILSGYQEFEYVKRGIDLGVKNYLLKPVDKNELAKSVNQIKKLLEEEGQLDRQQQLYLETNVIRWVNDELNEAEFEAMLQHFKLQQQSPYTAVLFEGSTNALQQVASGLQAQGQKLVVTSWIHQSAQLLWIVMDSRQRLYVVLHEIERQYGQQLRFLVGETVPEWENLYESYERVRQMQRLADFYPDLLPEKINHKTPVPQREEELSFLSFNKALMIGDERTVKERLGEIFKQLNDYHYPPEYVRYVAFLLFADLSRQFPNATQESYDETVAAIRKSQTIDQIQALLVEVLANVRHSDHPAVYSEAVSQVIALVEEDYREELNLKTIAEQLHLNVVYLGQLFKKETKKSFSQYLNQIRIKKAQQLLLYSPLPISEIAEKIGYNNTNYFSKMFKKLNGITPKEFRDQYDSGYQALAEGE